MDQNQKQQSTPETHVCMGTCQAVITDEQYKGGLTKCGAESCTMFRQPFVKGHRDPATGKNVSDE
jgi:hypothetical protein